MARAVRVQTTTVSMNTSRMPYIPWFFVEYRTSVGYLFGEKSVKILQWFFFLPPIIAVTMPIEAIWSLADMKRIIKKAEKKGIYQALNIASIWLERSLNS